MNLLPPEYAPESPYSVRNISFLLLSFLILTFLTLNTLQVTDVKKEFNQYKQDMLLLVANRGPFKQKVERLRKQTRLLNRRRNELAEVFDRRTTWSDKLSQVYAQIPKGVWLSEVSVKRETRKVEPVAVRGEKSRSTTEEVVSLHISGEAKDINDIAELISRLETISFLEKAPFRSINREEGGPSEELEQSMMSFEIIARVNTEVSTKI